MLFIRCLAATLMLFCTFEVLAQSYYRWVDDNGEVHYGQSVPPQFADYGYDRLGPDGSVRERIEPALTPEQIIERRHQRAEQNREAAAQRSRETRDRMLLASYSNEAALNQALELQLASLNSQRNSTAMALSLTENRFETLAGRAAGLSAEGRPVPQSLQNSIQETRDSLRQMRSDLARLDEREAAIRERFAADLARYRELTGRGGGSG